MSLSKENKIIRIRERLKLIPSHYKIHKQCENSESLDDNELSRLLRLITLKLYKLSDKGKASENRYEKSELGQIAYKKKQRKFFATDKGKEVKRRSGMRYWDKHGDEIKERRKKQYDNNKDYFKKLRNDHKEELNARQRERYATDINYKIKGLLRHRLWGAVKNEYKGSSVVNLLGCSIDEFKKHLELQFTDGMTWKHFNSGEIHIDHIKQLHTFDLASHHEQQKAFHHTNCRPLWASTKIINGIKYEGNLNRSKNV